MMRRQIIRRTLRIPAAAGPSGDGAGVARQLDAVLVGAGFTASREVLEHVSGLAAGTAMDLAVDVIGAVRELVGDHVAHNPYFIDFPAGVPDTVEFWLTCLRDAVLAGGVPVEEIDSSRLGGVNLLDLPTYGTYQHTYLQMLAVHDELVRSAGDRLTVLHLGGSLDAEIQALYLDLAGSPVPLGEADLALLTELSGELLDGVQPQAVPVRQNRAVLNAVRLAAGRPLVAIDTVTDVLRLACQVSDGDVSLRTPTRFRTFRRAERRELLAALERVVADNPGKLGDVARYSRRWQRLGERLHPHEYELPHARAVFAVARGERKASSLAGRVESAFRAGDTDRAVELLGTAPGMLLRQLDRVLRADPPADPTAVVVAVRAAAGRASGRVLCSLREHLANRSEPDTARIFVNRGRRGWVTPDRRSMLDPMLVKQLAELVDDELTSRVPAYENLMADPAVVGVALPLTGRAAEDGFRVLPRGSELPVRGELLRFFTYWKQAERTTDFDLSVLLLDEDFQVEGQVSWTNLKQDGVYHSGDVIEAADGATEFIDVPLGAVSARYIVPQVNIYSGEGFDEVAESMFGFMTRELDQRGAPFEPSTVQARSAMRGPGRVALPVLFARDEHGFWSAKWLQLYLQGTAWGNRTETNRPSVTLLARSVLERRYLAVSYLVAVLMRKARTYRPYVPGAELTEPVTFIGLERPDDLPEGSEVITPEQLVALVS